MQERKTLQREVKDDLGLQGARHTDLDLHIRTVDPPHVPDLQLEALLEDMDLTSIAIIVAEVAADEDEEDKEDPNTNPHFGVVEGQAIENLMSGDPRCSKRRKRSAKRDQ